MKSRSSSRGSDAAASLQWDIYGKILENGKTCLTGMKDWGLRVIYLDEKDEKVE